ncbi:MAG: hypothetical protein WBP81_04645 [Solirubrobacteraceae bacterium]
MAQLSPGGPALSERQWQRALEELVTALAELDPHLPEEIANHHPLARAWRAFEHALDHKIKQAAIAA